MLILPGSDLKGLITTPNLPFWTGYFDNFESIVLQYLRSFIQPLANQVVSYDLHC